MRFATAELLNERYGSPAVSGRLLGLLIVSMFPALFWIGVLVLIGAALGQPPSALTLVTIAAAIATFLFGVASALFARVT